MPQIKAVCFDLDGLMFNTELIFHKAGRQFLASKGCVDIDGLLQKMMGRRAVESYQMMIDELQLQQTIDEIRVESEQIFLKLLDLHLQPMPGLFELLSLIEHKQYPKGVATSSNRDYLHGILGRYELVPKFDVLLGAEDVTHGKPHPEIYLEAADRMGVRPEEMLVLEDSGVGTQAGIASGAHIVSIPHEHSRQQNFEGTKYIAGSLMDEYIVKLLEG
jgi:HAD superfamily hydrolase (TIGR01509 family)